MAASVGPHMGFYETLLLDHVTLVPQAVESVTETGIVDAEGIAHEVDVLVMATGFEAADYLNSLEVIGRGGRSLRDVWDGEPKRSWAYPSPTFRTSPSSMGQIPIRAMSSSGSRRR